MNWIRILLLGVGLFWAVAIGAALWLAPSGRPLAQLTADVTIDARFLLIDQTGREVTQQPFSTKPTAWFFGFTQCPEICPTTLAQMTLLLDEMGADADRLNVVFVSVDPERDTHEVLKEYLSAFDRRIVGLTGTRAAIDAMAKSFFVYQAKVPSPDGGYTMDHTATVLLTDRGFRFHGTLDTHEPTDIQLQKLRRLIADKAS